MTSAEIVAAYVEVAALELLGLLALWAVRRRLP